MSRSAWNGLLIGVIVAVGLGAGLVLGGALGSDAAPDDRPSESTEIGDTEPTDNADTEPTDNADTVGLDCEIPPGEPYVDGPSVELIELGESNGARVRGVVYPHPDYEGKPWTQWGQGVVLPDGRLVSAIGDHHGPDGNSYVYEYDPSTDELSMVADVLSYVDHVPGTWGYGKIHGQMTLGACGEVYFSTYWGTYRDIRFDGNYEGDILFRLDPQARTLEPLTVPVSLHGQASLAGAPENGLVYGEAIDPVLKGQDIDQGPFFAFDVTTGETVFTGPDTPHEGFRAMIVDAAERAYYSIGGGQLAVYDPENGELGTHPGSMPGEWLRAASEPAGDGTVYAVTREPDAFFAMLADGTIQLLGDAPGYTTSLALATDDSRVFFMPDAHGNAWESGALLMALDTSSGEQTVVAELNGLVEDGLGLTVGGTYNVAVSADGRSVYVGVNGSPLGDDSGFGEVALLVVELP